MFFFITVLNVFWKWFKRPNPDCVHLPTEVLSHIFSFLRIHDRKNVRLTCTQWYEACNTLSLIRNEKLIIRSAENETLLWFDVLMNCPRMHFDIESSNLQQFPPDATLFWQMFGPRVKSWKLVNSNFFTNEFGVEMMKFCNNLEKLHVKECEFVMIDCIQNSNGSDITHDSLKCLIIEDCPRFTDFEFSSFFSIYPCIEKLVLIELRINCHKRFDSRFYRHDSIFNLDSIFSFTCVFAHIKSKAENIKTLVLDRISHWGLTDDWLEDLASLPRLKLKELTLNQHPLLLEKTFFKFFSNQTHLEYVKIHQCQMFTSKCFLHMIRNCSRLETIKAECLDVMPNFSTSKDIFHDLMKLPSLKILKLEGMFFMEENVNINRVTPVSSVTFQHLQDLTLKMPAIYFDIFLPKIPANLSALHLVTKPGENGVTDACLQLIFEKWIHLRSLKLGLDSNASDFGFSGCRINSPDDRSENSGISINRLKSLEKLTLICNNVAANAITHVSFSHFVLPNLQKLKLVGFPTIKETSFKLLYQNTPSMECCEFQDIDVEDVLINQECWKNLCFIEALIKIDKKIQRILYLYQTVYIVDKSSIPAINQMPHHLEKYLAILSNVIDNLIKPNNCLGIIKYLGIYLPVQLLLGCQ